MKTMTGVRGSSAAVWTIAVSAVALMVVSGPGFAAADTWGVLVAGSNEFYNYRHQTDVCHSYQILHRNGVPDENIIVMIYDDVANDPQNPYPGQLFNKPASADGWDVYAGCAKDYTGSDVTAANFLHVITGNASAMAGVGSGKVLRSNANDQVFIFFSDHGGTGLVAFPSGPFLLAADLNAALKTMYTNKMYGKLSFYLEACESGSMFSGILPPNMNIYTTTASSPDEASWGTYCPPQDSVNGVEIGSCLGDLYSVSWMEDADRKGSMKESLESQYEIVRKETVQSHVQQYGDLDWDTLPIGLFEGNFTDESDALDDSNNDKGDGDGDGDDENGNRRKSSSLRGVRMNMRPPPNRRAVRVAKDRSADVHVNSRDVKLHSLFWRYLRSSTDGNIIDASDAGHALKDEIEHRLRVDSLFRDFARAMWPINALSLLPTPDAMPDANPIHDCQNGCCRDLLETVRTHCPALASSRGEANGWSDYALKYTRTIVATCGAVTHGRLKADHVHITLRSLCEQSNY